MLTETIKRNGFEANIVRTTRRKTARIQVHAGVVSIIVPDTYPNNKVDTLIDRRTRWIKEKLLVQHQWLPLKQKEFISGECFCYLGRYYRLKVESNAEEESVKLINGRLLVKTKSKQAHDIRDALISWYKDHAEKKLQAKVKRYSKLMNVAPASMNIRDYRARWGSCSSKGNIQFNWKIIIAPNSAVDYVVVHELCHLAEHNHSANFWKLVKAVMPDYEKQRQWLRENSHLLTVGSLT